MNIAERTTARSVELRVWPARPAALLSGAAILIAASGLALNWSWLTAIGAASIILPLLPCAVMCALGLCGSAFVRPSALNRASIDATIPDEFSASCCTHDADGTTLAISQRGSE